MSKQEVKQFPIEDLIGYAANPREHDHAVDDVAAAIKTFGFRVPIIAKSDGSVIDGHLRLKAAKKLKLKTVPVLLADDMTEQQIKAFRISVNKMADLASWNDELLQLEMESLGEDALLTGFSLEELEKLSGKYEEDEEEEKPKEINYAIQYNLVFDSEMQQESWFNFIKHLKTMYPDEETIGGRLRAFIQERSLGEA